MAIAGDIWGNCYLNDDEGDSIAISSEFVDNKAYMSFSFKDYLYEITLNRASLFGEYLFIIKQTNIFSLSYLEFEKLSSYGTQIKLNHEISCIVVD